jgi:hypothetical protein
VDSASRIICVRTGRGSPPLSSLMRAIFDDSGDWSAADPAATRLYARPQACRQFHCRARELQATLVEACSFSLCAIRREVECQQAVSKQKLPLLFSSSLSTATTPQHVDHNGVLRKRGCNDQWAGDHLDIEERSSRLTSPMW